MTEKEILEITREARAYKDRQDRIAVVASEIAWSRGYMTSGGEDGHWKDSLAVGLKIADLAREVYGDVEPTREQIEALVDTAWLLTPWKEAHGDEGEEEAT